MTRTVRELRDLEIDEVSLVDKGANQHAKTVIAKRHDEEENMDKYFDEAGNPVDTTSLQPGDVIFDEDGQAYAVELDEEEDVDQNDSNPFLQQQEEKELAEVGKSFSVSELREELSKALTDDAREEVIVKAFGALSQAEQIAKRAEAAAETERQLRLDREYTEVAKNYNVGLAPDVLGPVLKRAAESLSREDCLVLAKALDSASGAVELMEEIGKAGTGSNSDIFEQVQAKADAEISKSEGATREGLVTKAFDEDPKAYDEYLAEQSNR